MKEIQLDKFKPKRLLLSYIIRNSGMDLTSNTLGLRAPVE